MRKFIHWLMAAVLAAAASPASAAWYEAKTTHFLILADESPRDLQEFAVKLEKFDKAVRTVRQMDDPSVGNAGRLTIFVLKDTDVVSKTAVGKSSAIAGFSFAARCTSRSRSICEQRPSVTGSSG